MNRLFKLTMAVSLLMAGTLSALAQEPRWPRTVPLDEGMVTIYAPQVEALNDDTLYYRAALAYRASASAEPVFGAGWFRSPVEIDEDAELVHPTRLELTQTRFPDGTADVQAELASALAQHSTTWNLDFSVAELEAALDAAEAETLAAQKIKTAPPKIIYRDHPALLITIDGDPVLREIESSPYQAVVNTPYPLITDGDDYYLNVARGAWYRAPSAKGPYVYSANPPKALVEMVEAAQDEHAAEDSAETETWDITAENAPEIVVSTGNAELLVTDGPADFVPLVGDLLVLQNSDDDVFMDVDSQQYYIVLAGRWYTAPSLNGPWGFQAADTLPDDFANIPQESPQADSRVYVAGTEEAEEAVLDAHIPQTARIERGEVEIEVDYDGDPEFTRVDGTEDLAYARNTGATVLQEDRTYYLLEDGVWYVATSPHGPWVVSDHRPGELETIAPSSPVYNTKYVYVYDTTPEYVYVGYTPGYVNSYVYGPTVVYGTGWYYRPWVTPYYYYPRPSTWGFHVGYNNWSGWSFGLSWYGGPFSFSYYTGGYWHYSQPWYNRYWGYWGPRGYAYRPYYYGRGYGRGYRHGYRNGYNQGHDRHYGYNRHDKYRGDNRYDRARNRNLYRDDRQRARVRDSHDRWADNRRGDQRGDNRGPGNRGDNRNRSGNGNNTGPRRNRDDARQVVDNRKVRQSNTGPVRPADLRRKADVRDVNRAASREKFVANNKGEVYRASFDNAGPKNERRQNPGANPSASKRTSRTEPVRDTKARQSRTQPVSRSDLGQRANLVAQRSERSNPSARNNPDVQRNDRDVKQRTSRTQPTRSTASPAFQAQQRESQARANRQVTTVKQRESRVTPSKQPESRTTVSKQRESRVTTPGSQSRSRVSTSKQRESRVTPSKQRQSQVTASKQRESRVTAPSQSRSRSVSVQRSSTPARSSQRQTAQRQAAQRQPQRSAPKQRSQPQPSRNVAKSQPRASRNQGSQGSKARSQKGGNARGNSGNQRRKN